MLLEEQLIEGLAISEGIAIGKIHFLKEKKEIKFPEIKIPIADIENEIDRYRKALRLSRLDLEEIQLGLAKDGSIEAVTIIDSHIRMLDDPFMTTLMEERIRKMLVNTEVVFHSAILDYEKQFSKMQDAFFRQRLIDVQDLSQRILSHLYHSTRTDIQKIKEKTILFAKEFCPSHIAEAPLATITGFVACFGSPTAHAGLIARSKGIPFVAQISDELLQDYEGSIAILDGYSGLLIVNPQEKTLADYAFKIDLETKKNQDDALFMHQPTCTKDGKALAVYANIDSIYDLSALNKYHADGVGLLRSEFLFFEGEKNLFAEERQYELYSKIFENDPYERLVFRVFDFGGDKRFHVEQEHEVNPALGLRSIRFLLRYKDLFKTQLKALFRAACGHKLSLLLPFIADVDEMLESRKIIDQVLYELKDEIAIDLEIGAMIEMPSAVILCHQIIDHVDFLSVGTNDLIQYTLVADRQNASMHDVFKSTHPSIILMLKMIMDAAKQKNKPVCICGEMASNPLFTPLLLGLGFDALSCSLRYIPKIKEMMGKIDTSEAKILTQEILMMSTATEIHRLLTDFYCQLQFKED